MFDTISRLRRRVGIGALSGRCAFVLLFVLIGFAQAEEVGDERFHIYLDASQTGGSRAAGVAIERGIRTAIEMNGGQLAGRDVVVKVRDHRASTPRSRRHLEEFAADPNALVLFGGMHSPPILALRDRINEEALLMLVPWAAAGPITRGGSPDNWIFRLSVDDTKAGFAIARSALLEEGYERPYLLLEQTGWGDSNLRTMTRAIQEYGGTLAGVGRFYWGMGQTTAAELIDDAKRAGADVLFLVANTEEGSRFATTIAELPKEQRLPIRSHWGIAGGDFVQRVGVDRLEEVDLEVIQTRVSFHGAKEGLGARVLETAARLFPELGDQPEEMEAAPGFAHAFDLMTLLYAAASHADFSGDIQANRRALRAALYELADPVEGLVKTYERPFEPFRDEKSDGHEALGLSELTMGTFKANGSIKLPASPANIDP